MTPVMSKQLHLGPAVPDEELVRLCLDGDEIAWFNLIEKYRNLIFSIPIRQGFSRDDASEVFQDVCLKLLSELAQLRSSCALPAWLITVTTRRCHEWRSRNFQRSSVDLSEDCRAPAASTEMPDRMLCELQREQAVRTAIADLPARCRQLVEMLFFAAPAVSYEDVAKRFGIAKGSIGFIRMRCLKKLRRSLETKGFC